MIIKTDHYQFEKTKEKNKFPQALAIAFAFHCAYFNSIGIQLNSLSFRPPWLFNFVRRGSSSSTESWARSGGRATGPKNKNSKIKIEIILKIEVRVGALEI